MKYHGCGVFQPRSRHSPQGECGLKFNVGGEGELLGGSLPARGVRVEIENGLSMGSP